MYTASSAKLEGKSYFKSNLEATWQATWHIPRAQNNHHQDNWLRDVFFVITEQEGPSWMIFCHHMKVISYMNSLMAK